MLGNVSTVKFTLLNYLNPLFDLQGYTQKVQLLSHCCMRHFAIGGPLLHSFSTLCKNFHVNMRVGA